MKSFSTTLKLLLLCLATFGVAYGQTASGSLSGVVSDPNGAAIPDVKVTARHQLTGQEMESITTAAGLYVFPVLPTGPYTITVEKTGFRKLTRTGVEVRIASRLELPLQLEIGDVQQSIEVSAEAPLLEASTSERGTGFAPTLMTTLPLFTGGLRLANSFVAYMPGVNSWRETSINGSGGRGSEVLIDGASLVIPESGGVVFNFPGVEAFGEFKLLTDTFAAEHGRVGGGIQVFQTKSGTNDLHGAGFWYLRRDIFNANAWALNAAGRARPKERFNEMGGVIGGPVYIPKVYDGRNKTFFYLSYTSDRRPATISPTTSSIPTVRMKNGDFSEVPQLIYDPLTTSGNLRTPFAGNIIPRARMSAISQKFLSSLPDANLAGTNNNLAFVNESVLTDNIWTLKLDHSIKQNHRIAYFHTFQDQNVANISALPGPLGQGLGANTQRPQNFRGNYDWTISPTKLLHGMFGFSRTQQGWDNPAQRGFASKVGLSVPTDATPRIQFSTADNLTPWGVQDGKVDNGGQFNWTYHSAVDFTMVKGRHEFKMGGDIRRLQTFGNDKAGTNGRFFYERAQTALPTATGTTGHSFASFLLGAPNQVEFATLPIPNPLIRYGYHGFYFQDNWRVASKLTLNVGLRYEVPIGFHMENYQFSAMDPNKPNPAAGGLPGAMIFAGPGPGRTGTKRFYPTDWSNLGPRIGLAWNATPNTVVRGGFGIYYQTLGNGGCGCTTGFAGPPGSIFADGANPALYWDQGVPIPQGSRPPFIDPGFGILSVGTMDLLGPNFGKSPRVYTFSLNVQRTFKGFLFDAAYVGQRGQRLAATLMANQVDPKYLSLGTLLRQRIDNPEVVARGFRKPFAAFPDSQTLAQALRPFPQYFDVYDRNAGVGRTWYDSLQTKVERRFGALTLLANYTFSKSQGMLHYRQIFSQTQVQAQNNYDLGDAKSLLFSDQPHIYNLLFSYDLPFGKGKKFLGSTGKAMNLIVGGWQISGIQRIASGGPIDVAPANTLRNTLFTLFKKANRNESAPIQTGIDKRTLDPNNPTIRYFGCRTEDVPGRPGSYRCAAGSTPFVSPGDFELGSVSQFVGDFRQPYAISENLSIMKRFALFGDNRVRFSYRADFFNLFNRTNFGVNGTIDNPDFGRATGPQSAARFITMGLRLEF
ncbi:MAG: TonB-dependent receptor [Bryobacterales bacterium]|nr:TonB-dependent receptor [Bryobacterales bacterium]